MKVNEDAKMGRNERYQLEYQHEGKLAKSARRGILRVHQRALPAIVLAHVHMVLDRSLGLVHATSVERGIRRSIQVQGNRIIVAGSVGDLVQADLIGNVPHLVPVQRSHLSGHHLVALRLGHVVQRLKKLPLEDFHAAVGVGMVVNGTALSRRPNQDKKVCISVDVHHAVASVSLCGIAQSKPAPLALFRLVIFHDLLDLVDVYVVRSQPFCFPQNGPQVFDELAEVVVQNELAVSFLFQASKRRHCLRL